MIIDGTWIHYYIPDSNRQASEWLQADKSRPKPPKTQRSTGKVIASIFRDAHSIIFMDYFGKGKKITGEYYVTLLDKLDKEIKKKRPHMS